MSLTESNPFKQGRKAPSFSLVDTVDNQEKKLGKIKGAKGTVIMFICNHCPFVKHINTAIVLLAKEYIPKGIGFVAISSNDMVSHPQDAPDKMKQVARDLGYPFPYLFDETQEVARIYDATCTPDIYIFDRDLKEVYHGQLDDSRPQNGIPVTGKDLRIALDCLLQNKANPNIQKPSIGCNIKWKQ